MDSIENFLKKEDGSRRIVFEGRSLYWAGHTKEWEVWDAHSPAHSQILIFSCNELELAVNVLEHGVSK